MSNPPHQTHAVAAMAVVTKFSPRPKGGGSQDDSGAQTSDDEDSSVNSKFLADLKTESIHCRNQLAKQERQFEELKKVQHASMDSVMAIFTALEKKLDTHLGQLEDQSSSLQKQQRHLEELLNKDYSAASSSAEDHQRSADSADPSTPPSKRSKVASPAPLRLLPPRKAVSALEVPPPPTTSKPAGKRGPGKAGDGAIYDMAPYVYPGRWDVARCGQFSEIDQNGRRMRTTSSGWNVVIGREPADAFVVKVSFPTTKQKNTVAIGLTKEPNFWKEPLRATHSPFDFNQFGWFLNVQCGALCSKAGHDNAPYCTRFKTGDVLGVVLDTDTSKMRFFKNGRDLGVAFTVTERGMYPAVITYDRGMKLEIVEV